MPISLPSQARFQLYPPEAAAPKSALILIAGGQLEAMSEYADACRLTICCPETVCGPAAEALAAQLPFLLNQYALDPARIYLIVGPGGEALGRELLSQLPTTFAALIWAGQAAARNAEPLARILRRQTLWLLEDAPGTSALDRALQALDWKEGWDYFASRENSDLIRRWLLAQSRALPPLPEHPGRPAVITPEMQPLVEQMARERAARAPYVSRFRADTISAGCRELHYRLYVPTGCEPDRRYPLVLFLHGIGECGSDNTAPLLASDGGLIWVRAQDQGRIGPCFVLVPQCPWPIPGFQWEPEYLGALEGLLTELERTYPIDSRRLYATGLSLGGFGVWNLQRMFPGRFAALVSCCPACLKGTFWDHQPDLAALEQCAEAMDQVPLWLFHAQDDPEVPAEISETMAQRLRARGNTALRLTVYPAQAHWGHACWNPAFSDPALPKWLLSQSLSPDPAK